LVLLALSGCATSEAAAGLPALPDAEAPGLPALPDGVYSGKWVTAFETSSFTPCGTNYRWWIDGAVFDAEVRFLREHPATDPRALWVSARGTPSATGPNGHLGQYSRKLTAREVLEIRESRRGDCNVGPALGQTATDAPREGDLVLRLRVGPGYLSTTTGFNEGSDRSYSGAGFAFDAEIGGSLTSNVTLCAEVSGALALDASADDSATVVSGGSPATDLSTAGIGPSFTYTFNPRSIYIASNPAFTIVRTSSPDHFFLAKNWGSNQFGVGIGFVVGGEWQISSPWRLGVAAEARYAALSGFGDVSTMSEYALFVSATHG
jgi:hypothetical protein